MSGSCKLSGEWRRRWGRRGCGQCEVASTFLVFIRFFMGLGFTLEFFLFFYSSLPSFHAFNFYSHLRNSAPPATERLPLQLYPFLPLPFIIAPVRSAYTHRYIDSSALLFCSVLPPLALQHADTCAVRLLLFICPHPFILLLSNFVFLRTLILTFLFYFSFLSLVAAPPVICSSVLVVIHPIPCLRAPSLPRTLPFAFSYPTGPFFLSPPQLSPLTSTHLPAHLTRQPRPSTHPFVRVASEPPTIRPVPPVTRHTSLSLRCSPSQCHLPSLIPSSACMRFMREEYL